MSSVNKVILIGRLGQDPSSIKTAAGGTICSFSMATSESWKDKETGEKTQKTEWHRIKIFGKIADVAVSYCRKGDLLYVEGKMALNKWVDQEGEEKAYTEIQVNTFGGKITLLPNERKDGGGKASKDYDAVKNASKKTSGQVPESSPEKIEEFNDDIPF